jgi:uncharacterized membrane protein HdeD (DUF308 family)
MQHDGVQRRTSVTLTLGRNWWLVALRGVLAILFGLAAFVWPGLTLLALVLVFGVYAIVDGIFAIVSAVRAADRGRRWWPFAVEGVAGIVAGFLALIASAAMAVALIIVIAAWAMVTGVLEIVAAIRLREEIENEWLLALGGVLSIAFGIVLVVAPAAGAIALVWVIGAYALLFGALMLALGIRLRRRHMRYVETAARDEQSMVGADGRDTSTTRAA